jgi:hypothetical protein
MRLLPRATLHSDSEQLLINFEIIKFAIYIKIRGGRQCFFRTPERKAKKSVKKSKSAERKKNHEFTLFPPSHTGRPVTEPKDAQQGEK